MNALEKAGQSGSVARRPKSFTELQRERSHCTVTRSGSCERGYNYRWRKARLVYLKAHPLCVMCEAEGRAEQAVIIDHIVPHKGNRELFWNKNNWQGLCKHHHDVKTAKKDGRFGRV